MKFLEEQTKSALVTIACRAFNEEDDLVLGSSGNRKKETMEVKR